jgi:VWFA-related protein
MRRIALFLTAMAALGQAPPAANTGASTNPALIRFQVAPKKGQPVDDLRPEDIEIRVDGAPQKVAVFQGGSVHPRTIPIEVSLLFDCTGTTLSAGSLSPRLFSDSLLDEFPNVSISIYRFSGGISRLITRSHDQAALRKAMDSPLYVHPLSTFLMDHIGQVELDAASSPGPAVRILVVFSSGLSDDGSSTDTHEQQRYQRTLEIAQQTGVTVYPVILMEEVGPQAGSQGAITMTRPPSTRTMMIVSGVEKEIGLSDSASSRQRTIGNLTNLSSATGGKKIELLSDGNVMPAALKWIAEQIRNEYVAGYEPLPSGEKKKHKAEVVMRNKDRGRINGGARTLLY